MKTMRTVVLEPGEGVSAEAIFLRDRFSLLAFLLPFVWLAARGLWLFALLALLAQIGFAMLGRVEGFGFASSALPILFGVAVALEGPRLVVWRYRRRGWREAAVVHAADREEAELLYYGSHGSLTTERRLDGETQALTRGDDLPLFGWRDARSLMGARP